MLLAAIAIFQNEAIDFDHKGAPVARVVAAMGEAFDAPLKADGTMARDYLIVAFRDTTLEKAKEDIAQALNASWVEKKGELILHRSRAQELQDEKKERSANLAAIRRFQERIVVSDRLVGDNADAYIKKLVQSYAADGSIPDELNKITPITRAGERLLKELPAEYWLSFPEAVYVVLTLNGGFGTTELPKAGRQIVQEFVSDHHALLERIRVRAVGVPEPSSVNAISRSPEDVQVMVRRTAATFAVKIRSPLTEYRGRFDVYAQLHLDSPRPFLPPHVWPDGLDQPASFGSASREFMTLRSPRRGDQLAVRKLPSQELLDVFLKPEEHDQFELLHSESIIRAADLTGKSFVVVATEVGFGIIGRLGRQADPTVRQAIEQLYLPSFYELSKRGDSYIVRPKLPATARKSNYDRQAFKQTLDALLKRRNSLGPYSELAESIDYTINGLNSRLSMLSRVYRVAGTNQDSRLLLIYSRLSGAQRNRALSSGLSFSPRDLGEENLHLLEEVIASRLNSGVDLSRSISSKSDPFTESISESLLLGRLNANEVTVHIRVVSDLMLFRVSKIGSEYPSHPIPTSPERMAFWVSYGSAASSDNPERNDYFEIIETGIVATITVGGREMPLSSFYLPSVSEGDQFVSFESVSKEMRDRYERELVVQKKARGG